MTMTMICRQDSVIAEHAPVPQGWICSSTDKRSIDIPGGHRAAVGTRYPTNDRSCWSRVSSYSNITGVLIVRGKETQRQTHIQENIIRRHRRTEGRWVCDNEVRDQRDAGASQVMPTIAGNHQKLREREYGPSDTLILDCQPPEL